MAEHYFGITDTGRLRDNNEDAFIAEPVLNGQFIAACVIDGVGGYEGGEVAAAIARESILQSVRTVSDDWQSLMKGALISANEKIYLEKINSKTNGNMACVTTLAIVDIANNNFYYAHVGDTRLYLLRDSSLVKVTKDHSFVGFLEDTNRLTEAAAMSHPKRNEINKALGFSAQIPANTDYIETGESPFLPGDVILLCSDGLTDMIDSSTITSILTSNKSLEEKCKDLVAGANDAGGKDNITVVLVQNNNKPIKQKATKPVVVKKKLSQTKDPLQQDQEKGPEIKLRKAKGSGGIIAILSILCLLSVAGFFWLLSRQNKKDVSAPIVQQIVKTPRNSIEQKLIDTLNGATGDTLTLTDSLFGKAILLTDTLWINNDSIHIQGNGTTITRDASLKNNSAVIVISPDCKYVMLDSLTLQDFDIAIITSNNALQLKNVRFANCGVHVAYKFPVADSIFFSGKWIDEQQKRIP
ncbi:MAG: PP2C family serine/threonine-protein phosphatase [Chitinophagaceae bacterium]